MAISPSDFNVSISPNPIGIVIGMEGDVNLSFSNTSTTERGYNLSAEVKLPDGVSFVNSSVNPTSIVNNSDGTTSISWTNIKDLAPNELNYTIRLTLKSDENFRETGLPVPFDVPLINVELDGSVDTLPRGDDEPGPPFNQVITKSDGVDFIPLRYDLQKSAPGKIPKGAGIPSSDSPQWPYEYTLTVMNNSRQSSTVTLIDNLPNGVRYLGNLSVTGPDASILSNPTIIQPDPLTPDCQDFVTLNWGSIVLSPNSINIIKFDAAIWDNYTQNCIENSGNRILHMTPLQNISTLDGLSGPVQGQAITNAMDATINKSANKKITDVGEEINYTLSYRINQYDNVENFTIIDLIDNSQTYISESSSITPDSITNNPDGTTEIIWNLGTLSTSTSGIITFKTTVDTNFTPGNPVSSDDSITNEVNINGINQSHPSFSTPDNSSTILGIEIPSIQKEILNYYYKDGSIKPFDIAAPGDSVEFKITYSSLGINAVQKNIEIDEYAPPNMGPLTSSLPITYGGNIGTSFIPVTVTPNGLRWNLGTVSGDSIWTATFKVPVQNIDFIGIRNNLAKLAGENTAGLAYSDRDQVEVDFGQPNIKFNKSVSGPNVNAIKAGETYTFTITISNPQNSDGNVVDAFQMDLTDEIPDGLTFNGNFNVTGSGSYDTPVFSGQSISMLIKKLAPDESLTFSYEITVDEDIVSGQKFKNLAILDRPYSQPDRSYQYPGDPLRRRRTLKAKSIILNKLIAPTSAKIGDTVSYILQITVPEGTNAYNVTIEDNFPNSKQDYIVGSGTPVEPTVLGGNVIFPAIPFIDATDNEVTLAYSFKVRVISGNLSSPFVENQTDKSIVRWDIDNKGTPANPVSILKNLKVKTPKIKGLKEFRNVTKGGVFNRFNVQYEVGDIIEYRILLTNEGEEKAFNIVATDNLDSLLSFVSGSISTTKGSAVESSGTIIWTIPQLDIGQSATLVFRVITQDGVSTGSTVPDSASYLYNTNNNGFGTELGPEETNTVLLRSPNAQINKTSDTDGELGDIVSYNIEIIVPKGTIAYRLQLIDTLPAGQEYITGSAKRQGISTTPASVTTPPNQVITFTENAIIDATSEQKIIIYTFDSRITEVEQTPPYTEEQTNTAKIKWAFEPSGSFKRNKEAKDTITATTSHISILKEQKKEITDDYTTDDIEALPDDNIYYRLTITSDGASTAYNIQVKDILDDFLQYVDVLSGTPTPTVTGNTLEWNIGNLALTQQIELEFYVKVKSGIGAGAQIPNLFDVKYFSNEDDFKEYNQSSNIVNTSIPNLEINKTSDPNEASIGEEIDYEVTVTIPDGIVAYNLKISDVIPPKQEYKSGSWNSSTPGSVNISGNTINFEADNTQSGPTTLIFTFTATIINGILTSPYEDNQLNIVNVIWDVTETEGPTLSNDASTQVKVNTPKLVIEKEQRILPSGSFTKDLIPDVELNDEVEYRITIINIGKGFAQNIVATDSLDTTVLSYQNNESSSKGSVSFSSPNVVWQGFNLAPEESAQLTFTVKVISSDNALNKASTDYSTSGGVSLETEESNEVGFTFVNPTINKLVDNNTVILGIDDNITYTIEVVIPNGEKVYDYKVSDVLPAPFQSYIAGTLKKNGVSLTPVSTSPFVLEEISEVDATSGEVVITYTFEASIDSLSSSPQDEQINTATLEWKVSPSGTANSSSDSETVYVTDTVAQLSKTHRNFSTNPSGDFTTNLIHASVGDIVYYKFKISNTSTDSIFNIIFNDIIDNSLEFVNVVKFPQEGSYSFISSGTDTILVGEVYEIPADTSYDAILSFKVVSGSPQGRIKNKANITYTASETTPEIDYGPIESEEIEIELESLQIEKTSSLEIAELGQIIQYNIDVTIPNGTTAYNLVITDTLPTGVNSEGQVFQKQLFVGEAKRNGIEVFPAVDGPTITFEPYTITALDEDKIVRYSFKARVVEGTNQSPYTQIQTNNVQVSWEIDEEGTPASPESDSKEIQVNSPKTVPKKDQRNATKKTGFTTDPLLVELGDKVEFRLVVHNFGSASAYNIVITDDLDQYYTFNEIIDASLGSALYNPSTDTVKWTIDELEAGKVAYLIFEVTIEGGRPAGGSHENLASLFYDTNTQTPITIGLIETNKVIHNYPPVRISKTADIKYATIGNIITYTTELTLPKGTIAYNLQYTDILPVGQKYENIAYLNGIRIEVKQIDGQFIAFPIIPFVEANTEDKTFIYSFKAKVMSTKLDSNSIKEIQTNDAEAKWFLEPDEFPQNVFATENINVTTSNISIEKYQRNTSYSQTFTQGNTNVSLEDIIEYKLTVKNTGPRKIYDVIVEDELSESLDYAEKIFVPQDTMVTFDSSQKKVVWSIPELEQGKSLDVIFSVRVSSLDNKTIDNLALGSFRVSLEDPNRYGRILSNEVTLLLIENICIITDKIYSQCKKKTCIENISIYNPFNYTIIDIKYSNGKIIKNSLKIEPLQKNPNLSNVSFKALVPFTIKFKNKSGDIITEQGSTAEYLINSLLYIPQNRDEIKYEILLDTSSLTLQLNEQEKNFTVGINNLVSVKYRVQLFIPSYGKCSNIPSCQPYEDKICENFFNNHNYNDFYPSQNK